MKVHSVLEECSAAGEAAGYELRDSDALGGVDLDALADEACAEIIATRLGIEGGWRARRDLRGTRIFEAATAAWSEAMKHALHSRCSKARKR